MAYITASSSLGVTTGGNYEARFNLNVDSTSGNASMDRWINAYTDSADGTDKNVDVSWLTPVSAGKHTFYFLGARYNGAGTVQLAHHRPAAGGDQRLATRGDDRRCHVDAAALRPAGDQGRQHLQDDRRTAMFPGR